MKLVNSPTMSEGQKSETITNLPSTVSPFLYICKVLGLAPVKINQIYEYTGGQLFTRYPHGSNFDENCASGRKNSFIKCQLSIAWSIFNIAMVTIIIASTPVRIIKLYSSIISSKMSYISAYTQSITLSLQAAIALLCITLSTCRNHWERFGDVLNVFNKLDNILFQNKVTVYGLTRTFLFLEIAAICLIVIPYNFLSIIVTYHDWFEACVGIMSIQLVQSVSFIFNILVGNMALLVKQRLSHLNGQISKIAAIYKSDEQEVTSSPGTIHKFTRSFTLVDTKPLSGIPSISILADQPHSCRLYALRQAHSSLCDAIHTINKIFGLRLLLNLLVNFIVVIQKLYWIVMMVFKIGITIKVTAISFGVLVIIMNVTFLILSCDCVNSEASDTIVVLQKMTLLRGVDQHTMAEAQMFLQQVNNRKVHFTADGFFTLDRAMLLSALGAVMTYLVILVQFQIN